MSQEIVRAKQWNQKTRVRSGMVVIFEDAYFLSDSGVNSQPTNGYDWVFLGTVEEMNGGSGNIKSFPTKDDFPVPGEESTIYLDLSTDLGYVWDFETEEYKGIGVDEARLIAIELKNTQQDLAIAGKMQKPDMPGFYFINQTGGIGFPTSFIPINPSSYFVTYWNGSSFQSSKIKQNGTNIELDDPIILKKVTNDQMVNLPSPVEGMIVFRTDLTKGIFNYQSGSWLPIGSNLGNSDLSNSSARTFAQGNSFTWNTAGFGYFWKGLVDKTGQAAYSKSLIIHPTTGETVTRDFADPAATTLAVQNASAAQKTAMRTALLGSSTPASPVINYAFPLFLIRGIDQYIYLTGINLTLLDPTNIYFIDSSAVRRDAFAYYNITGSEVQTLWNIPAATPKGTYDLKILNGSTTQGLSNGVLQIVDSSEITNKDVLVSESVVRMYGGLTPTRNYNFNNNLLAIGKSCNPNLPTTPVDVGNRVLDLIGSITVKTDNFLSGLGSSSWDIVFLIRSAVSNVTYSSRTPLFGITETTNADFTSIESLIKNYYLEQASGDGMIIGGIQVGLANGTVYKIAIRKTGDKLMFFYFSNPNSNTPNALQVNTIDTTKNYALFFSEYNNAIPNYGGTHTYEFLQLKYKN